MLTRRYLARISVALIVALLAACATVTPIGSDRDAIRRQVGVGDVVAVTTVAGDKLRFKVEALGDTAISGEGEVVSYADIGQLGVVQEKEKVGALAFLVGALIGVGLVVLWAMAVEAGTDAAIGL